MCVDVRMCVRAAAFVDACVGMCIDVCVRINAADVLVDVDRRSLVFVNRFAYVFM